LWVLFVIRCGMVPDNPRFAYPEDRHDQTPSDALHFASLSPAGRC
jgi:hypothetical protein